MSLRCGKYQHLTLKVTSAKFKVFIHLISIYEPPTTCKAGSPLPSFENKKKLNTQNLPNSLLNMHIIYYVFQSNQPPLNGFLIENQMPQDYQFKCSCPFSLSLSFQSSLSENKKHFLGLLSQGLEKLRRVSGMETQKRNLKFPSSFGLSTAFTENTSFISASYVFLIGSFTLRCSPSST